MNFNYKNFLPVLFLIAGCASHPEIRRNVDGLTMTAHDPSRTVQSTRVDAPFTGKVAPGFLIKISNPQDKNLNGEFRVDFHGFLSLPYDVQVKVQGVGERDLTAKIRSSYAKFFKTPAAIQTEILERKYWVDARGLFHKPGRYLVDRTTSVDELFQLAGGIVRNAGEGNAPDLIRIRQGEYITAATLAEYYTNTLPEPLPYWNGGDYLFLEPHSGDFGNQVVLLGEVKRPGNFAYRKGADFFHYLTLAEGPTSNSDISSIRIIKGPNRVVSAEFDLDDSDHPEIQPGDVLIVKANQQTVFDKILSRMMSVASIIGSIALLIIAF